MHSINYAIFIMSAFACIVVVVLIDNISNGYVAILSIASVFIYCEQYKVLNFESHLNYTKPA